MLVVGSSLARAFGIVGAAGLVRYRAKIEDPKDAGVMLSTLAVGQSIHVSDLKLPAGVTAVTRPGASPVVATAIVPRIVVEVEEVVAPTTEAVAGEAAPAEGAKPGDKAAEKGGEKPSEKGADKAPAKKDDKK